MKATTDLKDYVRLPEVHLSRRSLIAGTAAFMAVPAFSQGLLEDLPPAAIRALIARAANAIHGMSALWPGAPEAEMLLLLVGIDHEYLFFHDGSPDRFGPGVQDPVTGSLVHRRDRVFDPGLLATFPAVDGLPTIVIGFPEATDQPDPADWVLTLLHEHFHQLQYSSPDYYGRTSALDLAGEDETGMWMLNYGFPFAETSAAFAAASTALRTAIDSGGDEAGQFLAARAAMRNGLAEPDWRYLAFQVWQEGVARHAEIEIGLRSDEAAWQRAAETKRARILTDLSEPDLAESGRIAFYSYGAGEAMLLDCLRPDWRSGYFEGPLSLDPHFDALAS